MARDACETGVAKDHEHLQKYPGQGNALTFHNGPKQEEPKYPSVKKGMWYIPCSIQWNISQPLSTQQDQLSQSDRT